MKRPKSRAFHNRVAPVRGVLYWHLRRKLESSSVLAYKKGGSVLKKWILLISIAVALIAAIVLKAAVEQE
jgi:hypothetical protein